MLRGLARESKPRFVPTPLGKARTTGERSLTLGTAASPPLRKRTARLSYGAPPRQTSGLPANRGVGAGYRRASASLGQPLPLSRER